MENINQVTITELESKALKYNKKVTAVVKYETTTSMLNNAVSNTGSTDTEKKVIVIDNTHAKDTGESVSKEAVIRPIARIVMLEKLVEDLLERVQELEDVVYRVLSDGGN